MANTGYKGYSNLEWYYVGDGASTGKTKANTVGQADYVAPVYDTTSCPAYSLYLNAYEVDLNYLEQTTSFQITSNYPSYTLVSSDSSWLFTDITSGGGNSTVMVYVTQNSVYARGGQISVQYNGVTIAEFYVNQTEY